MSASEDPVARLDQACASMAEAARMHAAYFNQLVTSGLQRTEAVELTIGYIDALGHDYEGED